MRCLCAFLSLLALSIVSLPAQAVPIGAVFAGDELAAVINEYAPGLPPPVSPALHSFHAPVFDIGGLAFDPTSGLLLVGDLNGRVIEMLDPDTGAALSSLFLPQTLGIGGLAVDPVTGDIWVGDPIRREVQHYSSAGDFLGGFPVSGHLPYGEPGGIALDANGDVWVGDFPTSEIRQFTPTGTLLGGFPAPFGRLGGLAFDLNGDLLVGANDRSEVWRVSAGGADLGITELTGLPSRRIGGLTLVPEPSTGLLLALGLGAAAVTRRRMRSRSCFAARTSG
jgi:DNA-binding beta-propeller fold protein YncE